MAAIDLNSDLGETVNGAATADDEAMFAVISSASIACGGHAGDEASMVDAVARARRHGVAIGAHPSYPDRENFGRTAMTIPPGRLQDEIARQLDALRGAGADIRYVKPHGALYHAAAADGAQAQAVVAAVAALAEETSRPVPILGIGGALERAAGEAGVPFVREAFLDRGYDAAGALIARGRLGDLLRDPAEVAARSVRLVREGVVEAADGSVIAVRADSLCVHGDTPAAVAMARAVRAALDAAGIEVRAPW